MAKYNWKGLNAGYCAFHIWIKKHKPYPEDSKCQICNEVKDSLELMNLKDHNYTRDPEDYKYACAKCHRNYDNNKKRDKNTLICVVCGKLHSRYIPFKKEMSKYCSEKCRAKEYYQENKNRILKQQRENYNKDKKRAYYLANREKILTQMKENYKKREVSI